jgi:hypothetical protein
MKRIAVIAVLAVTALGAGGTALAGTEQYRADPVGDQEVPTPVDTDATADFKLKVAADGESARYDLKIKGPIDDAFMAHLHLGAAGENGPIVVWLWPHDGPPPAEPTGPDFRGRLAKDVITPDDLVGPFAGDWDGFLAALDAGDLYVNIHTLANPGGELRDQVTGHPGG